MTDPFALSVVMPVYAGVDPGHLRRAVESVYAQTLAPAEVVIVADGPLTSALDAVIAEYADAVPPARRVDLPENKGAAAGNQAGLEAATMPWIAKMDADDVCLPERFATQVAALRTGGVDALGTAMHEFVGEESNIVGLRSLPEDPTAYARMNSPINHPTVVYRRQLALDVGGYRHLPYMEDYDLFARMLAAGATLRNLPEPLLLFRAGDAMLSRRRSPGIHRAELAMQQGLVSYGLVSRPRAAFNLVSRTAFRLLPRRALAAAYRKLFHRGR